jgi:CHAT domain-containing protein
LCVTGDLGFLPIHAAGRYDSVDDQECAANYLVFSYAPTLSAIIKARHNWEPIERTDITGLLVCETSSGSDFLPNVMEEIKVVGDCFAASSARVMNSPSPHTSVAEMRLLLEEEPAHILHLASHGIQETDPLKSSFLLQDGRLSIDQIMHLELPHAVLAFLSACQTAKGDANVPDQAVHLAASMLFCGFRSVIGTMWCVTMWQTRTRMLIFL